MDNRPLTPEQPIVPGVETSTPVQAGPEAVAPTTEPTPVATETAVQGANQTSEVKVPEPSITETVMQAPEAAQVGQGVMGLANQGPAQVVPEAAAAVPAEQNPAVPEVNVQPVTAPVVGFHDAAPIVSTPEAAAAPTDTPVAPETVVAPSVAGTVVAPATTPETVVTPPTEQSPAVPEASAEQTAQMPVAETNVTPQARLGGNAA